MSTLLERPPIDKLHPLIIIPTYNECDNVAAITRAVLEVVGWAHILIIDDNSPDGTGDIADGLAESDVRIHVLHRAGKEGLGKAYAAGFRWAIERDYDRVFEMDADFSHPPEYLPAMLEASFDADVVIGSRYVEGGRTENWGLIRRIISKGGSLYARSILGLRLRDLTAGFVCWRPEVLAALPLESLGAAGYGFQIELKYRADKLGYRVTEVPIHFPDRRVGDSKMSRRIVAEALLSVWKLRFSR